MRTSSVVAWALLLVLIAVPTLRHASAVFPAGSRECSVRAAPLGPPPVARTAVVAAVGFVEPAPVVVDVALAATTPRIPTSRTAPPLAPLRL